jgi:hypothetical protein
MGNGLFENLDLHSVAIIPAGRGGWDERGKRRFQSRGIHNIIQYMSYEIAHAMIRRGVHTTNVVCTRQKPFPLDINYSLFIMKTAAPQIITPDKLPNPWLADSEWLLQELAKAREQVLTIPCTLNNASNNKLRHRSTLAARTESSLFAAPSLRRSTRVRP